MPNIIQYLQARNLVQCVVAVTNPAANGDLVFGTGVDLSKNGGTGTFKSLEVNGQPTSEMFRASDLTVANYQIEFDDWTATLTELTPANGSGVLTAATVNLDYVRIDAVYRQRGVTSGGIRVVIVGVRDGQPFRIGDGQNTQSLGLKPCGFNIWTGLVSTAPPI